MARFYYLNKLTGRPAELILSMVMDRCIGVVALMSVPFLVMPMYQPTGWLSEAVGLVYVVVSAVLILGIALGHLFNRGRPPLQAMPRPTRLHALLDSLGRFLQLYAEQKGILLQVLGVAVTSHILNIGIYFGLGAALGEGHRALEFFFFLPMVILATLLPLSLGGHGIREWTFVSIFTTLGMPRQTALSISLLSLLVKISASLVGAALYLTYGRSRHG